MWRRRQVSVAGSLGWHSGGRPVCAHLVGGDVVLAHYVGVAAMRSPHGARVGVLVYRNIVEPVGGCCQAGRCRGLGLKRLVRLTGASARRVSGARRRGGECGGGWRQRDERGDKGWQDDGAFHGIPYLYLHYL